MKTNLSLAIAFLLHLSYANAQSVLSTGNWFKLSVSQEGIYCLTHSNLSSLGINPSQIDPRNIALFGNVAGMLPMENFLPHADDLQEMAIVVKGENDGTFDVGDTVFFYGQSSVQCKFDPNLQKFYHRTNIYSDSVCYFLTVKNTTGKRIQTRTSLPNFTDSVNSYTDFEWHEMDSINLLHSGTAWYGESVTGSAIRTLNFDLVNISTNDTLYFKAQYVGRSLVSGSNTVGVQYNSTMRSDIFTNSGSSPQDNYGQQKILNYKYPNPGGNGTFDFILSSPDPLSEYWIDYVELNFKRQLKIYKPQQLFSDFSSVGANAITKFIIENVNPNSKIWDVSDPINVVDQQFTIVTNVEFNVTNDSLHTYVIFDGNTFLNPVLIGQIPNQNLHAISQANMIIVTDRAYLNEANSLASFHQSHDGLTTVVATVDEIYNEYSSGVQDVVGIRDFVRQIYNQSAAANDSLKHLLLFGSGSYDFRGRLGQKSSFIPVYQSAGSLNLTQTYFNEFIYADLGDSSGTGMGVIPLISVGRLPVKNSVDATVVNKIINYSSSTSLGPWRTKYVSVADDGDHDTHFKQADTLSNRLENDHCELNIDKIYIDSYVQITTPSGEFYPVANADLQQNVSDGSLVINYIGHGSETKWANEDILDYSFLGTATNSKLPFFITATTWYNKMDDPMIKCGGEVIALNPDGAGIACAGIGRLAFSSSNFNLEQKMTKYLLEKANGSYLTIGEIILKAKQDYYLDPYVSAFCLLGDPAVRLNVPKYEVVTTTLNGNPVSTVTDTLIPGQSVQLSGEVQDGNGNLLSSFNGLLNVTFYDQKTLHTTLGNDPGQSFPSPFYEWDDTILSDTVAVVNGIFNTTVNLAWSLDSGYGIGRISYYAQNGTDDAWGCYQNFVYENLHAGVDDYPEVKLNIYPNPSDNFIEFDITGIEVRDFNFSLIDIQSKLVRRSKMDSNKFILEKSGLASGIYYFEISDNKKLFTRRGKIVFQ